MSFVDDFLEQDDIFTILAHPLRRRILRFIFENGSISFTLISKEWKVSTGTLYHHLKILDVLLVQDENSLYRLNDKGMKVCTWFIQNKTGIVTVKKIDSFTMVTNSVLKIIENYQLVALIFSLLVLGYGYAISKSIDALIVGPFILQISSSSFLSEHLNFAASFLVNLLITLILLGLYLLIFSLLTKKRNNNDWKLLIIAYLFSLTPSTIILIIAYLINLLTPISVSIPIWVIISVITQLIMLFINSSIMVGIGKISIERSVIVILINLYLFLTIGFLLV